MSNVTLSIGGREFTVACAEGEEAHVLKLGRMIDSKIGDSGAMKAQSESRVLLYAALLLADDLHDARNATGTTSPAPTAPSPTGPDPVRLESIALRLENLASRLEDASVSA